MIRFLRNLRKQSWAYFFNCRLRLCMMALYRLLIPREPLLEALHFLTCYELASLQLVCRELSILASPSHTLIYHPITVQFRIIARYHESACYERTVECSNTLPLPHRLLIWASKLPCLHEFHALRSSLYPSKRVAWECRRRRKEINDYLGNVTRDDTGRLKYPPRMELLEARFGKSHCIPFPSHSELCWSSRPTLSSDLIRISRVHFTLGRHPQS